MIYVTRQNSSIIINNITSKTDIDKVTRQFSLYDEIYHKWNNIACYYNEDTNELRIPDMDLGYLQSLIGEFEIIESVSNRSQNVKVPIELITKPRNQDQVDAIEFTTGLRSYSYTRYRNRLCLNLATGLGKTFCTIATMSVYQKKMAIISESGILDIWIPELFKHSNIDESRIKKINSSKLMDKLFNGEEEYDLYLFSHTTLRNWCKKNGWDKLNELFAILGLHILVFDEYHKQFTNVMKVNMFSNVHRTIYLSATDSKGDWKLDKIFQKAFMTATKLVKKISNDEKNVITQIVKFNSKPSTLDKTGVYIRGQINRGRYMRYIGTQDLLFDLISNYLTLLIPKKRKIVIFLGSLDTIKKTKIQIEECFDVSVGNYSSLVTKDKENELVKDVILTTYGSLGTGKNVPDLYYILNFETYSDPEIFKQIFGRLRNKKGSLMVEFLDMGFSPTFQNQLDKRLPMIKQLSKTVQVANWDE